MIIGYVHVSKKYQASQASELLEFMREGDTVVVHDLSRLARSTKNPALKKFQSGFDKRLYLCT